jgi:hypothetical protein
MIWTEEGMRTHARAVEFTVLKDTVAHDSKFVLPRNVAPEKLSILFIGAGTHIERLEEQCEDAIPTKRRAPD